MIPELGQFALILATVLSVLLGVVPLWGTLNRNTVWQSLARPAAFLQFALVLLSLFATRHFYFATSTNTITAPSIKYKINCRRGN